MANVYKRLVKRVRLISSQNLASHFDKILSKLVTYEQEYPQVNEVTFLLELALWKSKIDEIDDDTEDSCLLSELGVVRLQRKQI